MSLVDRSFVSDRGFCLSWRFSRAIQPQFYEWVTDSTVEKLCTTGSTISRLCKTQKLINNCYVLLVLQIVCLLIIDSLDYYEWDQDEQNGKMASDQESGCFSTCRESFDAKNFLWCSWSVLDYIIFLVCFGYFTNACGFLRSFLLPYVYYFSYVLCLSVLETAAKD